MKNINPAAKNEITFFAYFVLQTKCAFQCCLVSSQQPSSYRCHKILRKVPFKFSSYLTLLPFYVVSLVFVLFFSFGGGEIIIVLRYKVNSLFQCTCWHFASISWGYLVAIEIRGTQTLNHSLTCCSHSALMQFRPL